MSHALHHTRRLCIALATLTLAGCIGPLAPPGVPVEATGSWIGHLKEIDVTLPDATTVEVTAFTIDGGTPLVDRDHYVPVTPGTTVFLTSANGKLIFWNSHNVVTATATVYGLFTMHQERDRYIKTGEAVIVNDPTLSKGTLQVRRLVAPKPTTKPTTKSSTQPSTKPATLPTTMPATAT